MSGNRQGQRLSPREREVIGALCMGETAGEIAKRWGRSVKTVQAHIENAKVKLGARTQNAAVYQYVTRYRSEV